MVKTANKAFMPVQMLEQWATMAETETMVITEQRVMTVQ